MAKIVGTTASTTMPVPDWEQTNPKRADFIKNKPDLTLKADVAYVDEKVAIATPERGVDYFTEEDKAEIVAAVIAALPNGDEVAY